MSQTPIIGIDLGTTNSCVAVMQSGTVQIIQNDQGNRTTPSYVAFTQDGERLIGEAARNQASGNPENTVFSVKRLIGRRWEDPAVQKDARNVPFKVVRGVNDKPEINVEYQNARRNFRPEQISAMVLEKMKQTAEAYLGQPLKQAVITVPAYFNDNQRQATKDAGAIAGLDVVRVINEPTAAALAYGLGTGKGKKQGEQNVLIFDLGGGTFDVSLLSLDGGIFEVQATAGDTHLGGEDFDERIMEYFVKEFERKHKNTGLRTNKRAMRRLRTACEKAKRTLSHSNKATIEMDAFVQGIDFTSSITRARFEDLCSDYFQATLKPVERVLADAKLSKREVDEVVLVGGSTRIPKIQQLLSDFFDGKELSHSINPDEAVAHGAAVQGAVIAGDTDGTTKDLLLIDVLPLSLGIETAGGVMSKVVERNTSIPCRKSQTFSTFADNQTAVTIQVYQGERTRSKDNHLLGRFDLTGIPPAPRGQPQIEVSFSVNENGILDVEAVEKAGGNKKEIRIESSSGNLSQADIDRMQAEAEEYAEQDKQFQARVDAKNKLEGYCLNLKSSVINEPNVSGKLDAADLDTLKRAVQDTMDWVDGPGSEDSVSAEDFQSRQQSLESIVNPITSKLYQQQQPNQNQGAASNGPSCGAGAADSCGGGFSAGGPKVEEVY